MKRKSPTRLTTNAFFAAFAFARSVCQKPIRPHEQRPTPSQPMNMIRKLFPSTRISIANMNRFSHAMNFW